MKKSNNKPYSKNYFSEKCPHHSIRDWYNQETYVKIDQEQLFIYVIFNAYIINIKKLFYFNLYDTCYSFTNTFIFESNYWVELIHIFTHIISPFKM